MKIRFSSMSVLRAVIGLACIVALASSAFAHHGTRVAYDWTQSVRVSGVVTEFALKNPHSFLIFDVTDEDGNVVSWGAEMPPVAALRNMGVSRSSLEPGDRVEISLYPSRAGAPRGQHIVQEPLLINGISSVAVGTAASPALTAIAPVEKPEGTEFNPRDLSGVWFSLMRRSFTGEDGPIVIAESPPMTAAGKAKYFSQLPSFGPRAIPPGLGNDPWGTCNPPGIVRTLFFAAPIEFIQNDAKLTQLFEISHFWRTVPTNGRALPKDPVPSWFGTSSGRWENNTFVIETTSFHDSLWLDSYAHPLSENARLVERWTRINHSMMELELTLHDPQNYTAAIESPLKTFSLQPNRELQENLCAPIDEYSFNEKIRDPSSGRGVIETEEWDGDSGFEEGKQREAWKRDLERMRSEDKN